MFCPFISQANGINSSSDKLYPCIGSCALSSGKDCYLKLLAQAQIKIANELNKNG